MKVNNLFSDIKEVPDVLNQKLYPSLNGLRAISIIMVIIHHYIFLYKSSSKYFYFLGPLGVDIFFVISGFLITTLCIREKIETGDLSLKNFYIRRILRILPVAYLYIIVILILNYFVGFNVALINLLTAALFLTNISYFQRVKFDWMVAHFWSVSVEEQFYLLFPVLIKKRIGLYTAIQLFVCVAVPLLVYLQSVSGVFNNGALAAMLRYAIKFQGISVGALFSIFVYKGYLNFGKTGIFIILFSILMIAYFKFDPALGVRSAFTNLATSIFVGLIIVNCIRQQNNLLFRFLNLKIMNLIGILSYSIYIWQQLFLSNDPKFAPSKAPLNFIWIIAVSAISYFCYEKYFLKLKNRFIKIKSRSNVQV